MPRTRRFGLISLIGLLLAACGAAGTPTSVPSTPSPSPTQPPTLASTLTPAPSPIPTLTPTLPPTPAPDTPTAAATPPLLECETGPAWTGTQNGASLALCFNPLPPRLGVPGSVTALFVDAAGRPLADAVVTVLLVGGMVGMEGEHDEEFDFELDSQGEGMYAGGGTIGPDDLALTGVLVRIRRGSDLWSFSIPARELAAP